jgi:hypothetical protein
MLIRKFRRAVLLTTLLLIAAAVLAGCSRLRGSRRLDVGPFSENTMGMVGELQKLYRPAVWTRLKKYQTLESVTQAQATVNDVRVLMRGITFYSTQVAALYEAPMSEDRKVLELARYMNENVRPNLPTTTSSAFPVTQGYMDTLITNIETHKTMLAALGAAQPLVSLTVAAGDQLFDRLDSDIRTAANEINAGIEAEYAQLKARITELDQMHIISVRSFTQLQRLRAGDAAALDTLRQIDNGLRELLPAGRNPSSKDLAAAEKFVIDRTNTIKLFRDQLEPDFSVYRECQLELEMIRTQADERARLGRITLILWGRSHRNLAAGIPVPPVIDVVGVMRNTINTGVKGVVP